MANRFALKFKKSTTLEISWHNRPTDRYSSRCWSVYGCKMRSSGDKQTWSHGRYVSKESGQVKCILDRRRRATEDVCIITFNPRSVGQSRIPIYLIRKAAATNSSSSATELTVDLRDDTISNGHKRLCRRAAYSWTMVCIDHRVAVQLGTWSRNWEPRQTVYIASVSYWVLIVLLGNMIVQWPSIVVGGMQCSGGYTTFRRQSIQLHSYLWGMRNPIWIRKLQASCAVIGLPSSPPSTAAPPPQPPIIPLRVHEDGDVKHLPLSSWAQLAPSTYLECLTRELAG